MNQQLHMLLQEVALDQRIHLDDPHDCERWARYFDVTGEQLREAMRAVGTSGDEVRRFLGKPRPAAWEP